MKRDVLKVPIKFHLKNVKFSRKQNRIQMVKKNECHVE